MRRGWRDRAWFWPTYKLLAPAPYLSPAATRPVIEYVFYFRRRLARRCRQSVDMTGLRLASSRLITSSRPTAGLLDGGPDVNWPAEIQFIRWRLAFQETRPAYDCMACLDDGRTCTWREIRFSAAYTRRRRHRLCDRSFPLLRSLAAADLLQPSPCIIMAIMSDTVMAMMMVVAKVIVRTDSLFQRIHLSTSL